MKKDMFMILGFMVFSLNAASYECTNPDVTGLDELLVSEKGHVYEASSLVEAYNRAQMLDGGALAKERQTDEGTGLEYTTYVQALKNAFPNLQFTDNEVVEKKRRKIGEKGKEAIKRHLKKR